MKGLAQFWLEFYKLRISPCFIQKCRYSPTCSVYMLDAINKHGTIKGILMGMWRLLRCNPFSQGGYDPVPEKLKGKIIWVL